MLLLLPLIFLFSLLFTFTDLSNTQPITTNSNEFLKLRLLHTDPLPTPSEALSHDTHRLSTLFSLLRHNQRQSHKRRTSRHRRAPKLQVPVISGASTGSGQYFVQLRIGTPPQSLLLVADTGSDLIWVTCSACRNCSSRRPNTAFLARHSSTFSPHHCFDSACKLVPHPKHVPCNRTRLHNPCRYEYSYSDGSLTTGFFSKETTTFNTSSGRVVKYNGLSFGCGFHAVGPSVSGPSFNGANGVMGLGRGPISFTSQLGRKFGNKFSYCLMDYTLAPSPISYLVMGGTENVVVKGQPKLSYTPFQTNLFSPTFYYIGIQRVLVDGMKLQINASVWAIDRLGNGGTIRDSGTTLTFFPDPAYRRILNAFKRRVKLPSPTKRTPGFHLCVNVSGVSKPRLPRLSFELEGNSVFSPPPRNYFIDTADGIKCLALQPVRTPSGFAVIGNLMQQGFYFEFDKDRMRLGFSRHGCALP